MIFFQFRGIEIIENFFQRIYDFFVSRVNKISIRKLACIYVHYREKKIQNFIIIGAQALVFLVSAFNEMWIKLLKTLAPYDSVSKHWGTWKFSKFEMVGPT